MWGGERNFTLLFEDIVKRVFRSEHPAHLELCPLRGKDGEIGLRVHGTEQYYGLIYIDKTTDFRKLVEEEQNKGSGIVITQDAMAESLFADVRHDSSSINILIGARKFIEGWDSLRVSSIGLLNIGRAEGGQIIQLFGRGVRLLGLNRSLRRSSFITDMEHPKVLPSLERLLIFGIRATYMQSFKDYLTREGVDPDGYWVFELPLWKNTEFLKENLVIPAVPEEAEFRAMNSLVLKPDGGTKPVKLDLSSRVSSVRMGQELQTETAQTQCITGQLNGALPMLNWNELYLGLVEYIRQRGFHNLALSPEVPRQILSNTNPALHELTAPEEIFHPKTIADWHRLQEAALSLLQKYTDAYYRNRQKRYETENMTADRVSEDHPNMRDPYRVRVPRSQAVLAKAIKELCQKGPKQIWREMEDLRNIYFDRHLYQPLLVRKGNEEVPISPSPLVESEQHFVDNLRKYWTGLRAAEQNAKKLYVLRNLSRGHGVGFYEAESFFPDFIIWIVESKAQHVLFVEPHGMQYESAVSHKKRLFEEIRIYTKRVVEADKKRKLTFDAWIVSKTQYIKLRTYFSDDGKTPWTLEQFHNFHIVFQEETDYIARILDSAQ